MLVFDSSDVTVLAPFRRHQQSISQPLKWQYDLPTLPGSAEFLIMHQAATVSVLTMYPIHRCSIGQYFENTSYDRDYFPEPDMIVVETFVPC